MRVAVIGAGGQVGTEVVRAARAAGFEVLALSHEQSPVEDRAALDEALSPLAPGDVVVNTAAFHRTDACEDHPEEALAINAVGARNAALSAHARGAAIVYYSSDYVFDGAQWARPYVERDLASPINSYGVSKLAGETFVRLANSQAFVLRIASVFGVAGSSGKGGNFVETMLAKARRGEKIEVVDDIVMTPTYAADAADLTVALLARRATPGTYHLTNAGACSWYEFATAIIGSAGLDADITAVASASMPTAARRPAYSALASERLSSFGLSARPWRDALTDYLRARGHL
ncbi:MAG TPA: dTDP-4-dehydrorhamnose reductase [Candidatus Eremiobacteraceae bacterium]|nr:dTDP-4-dehydrorhamnose reductase [Candidatus Eremiobacteraceae bacterium]